MEIPTAITRPCRRLTNHPSSASLLTIVIINLTGNLSLRHHLEYVRLVVQLRFCLGCEQWVHARERVYGRCALTRYACSNIFLHVHVFSVKCLIAIHSTPICIITSIYPLNTYLVVHRRTRHPSCMLHNNKLLPARYLTQGTSGNKISIHHACCITTNFCLPNT